MASLHAERPRGKGARAGKGLSLERRMENRKEGQQVEEVSGTQWRRLWEYIGTGQSLVELQEANVVSFPVLPLGLHPEILIQLVWGGTQASVFFKVFQVITPDGQPRTGNL